MKKKKFNFSGYATKHDIRCSDGRTITKEAFKSMDGVKVPIYWEHNHGSPENVLGHAVLEHREDGIFAYGYFNESAPAKHADVAVKHGDIVALSIYANRLQESNNLVHGGQIVEVSLVKAGANPGAKIDPLAFNHDDDDTLDEALIYSGSTLKHSVKEDIDDDKDDEKDLDKDIDKDEEKIDKMKKDVGEDDEEEDSEDDVKMEKEKVQKVLESLTPEQTETVNLLVGLAIEDEKLKHSEEDEGKMGKTVNVFEGKERLEAKSKFTSEDLQGIIKHAEENGVASVKTLIMKHAENEYGITNIDILFPDAVSVDHEPVKLKEDDEWAGHVLSRIKKSPFSRTKNLMANLTGDEARARGYITGNMKKDEVISLLGRQTGPATVYKKQRLDRDNVIDITSFDVLAWLRGEMKLMLDIELARAALIGDGRPALIGGEANPDKIKEPKHDSEEGSGIRSVLNDNELYVTRTQVPTEFDPATFIDMVIASRLNYKGTGTPALYVRSDVYYTLMLLKDTTGRRIFNSVQEFHNALMVTDVVVVPEMDSTTDRLGKFPTGILVNMNDYNFGSDKGGELNTFEDFDMDFNQHKLLIETRLSGALLKPRSAVVLFTDVKPVIKNVVEKNNYIPGIQEGE